MSFTILSLILLSLLLGSGVLNAFLGYRSGVVRTSIKFASVVASSFIGAALALWIASMFGENIEELLLGYETFASLYESMNAYSSLFEVLVQMLSSAVLFIPAFIAIYIITRLVILAVYKNKSNNTEENSSEYLSENATFIEKNDKPIAAVIGAVCGMFIVTAVLSPVIGCLRSVADITDVLLEVRDYRDNEDMDLDPLLEFEEYANDFTVVVMDACGAGTLFDISTSIVLDGQITNLSSELRLMKSIEIAKTMDSLLNIGDFSAQNISELKDLLETIDKSPIMKMVTLISINEMAEAWLNGEEFMGMAKPQISDNRAIVGFIDEVLKVLSTSTMKTINKDLETFLELCTILNEYTEVFNSGSYSQLVDALASGELIEKLRNTLSANSHMIQVEHAIDEIIMRVVAEEVSDFTQFTYAKRDQLFAQIAEVLTDTSDINLSTRTDFVLEEVNSALNDYGVYSSEELSEKIASLLISGVYERSGVVTTEDVRSYFDSFLYFDSIEND